MSNERLIRAARRAASLLWEMASEVEDGVRTLNEDSPEGQAWRELTEAIDEAAVVRNEGGTVVEEKATDDPEWHDVY